MSPAVRTPGLTLIVGTNGSGKSTITEEFRKVGLIPGIYHNADEIVKGLGDWRDLEIQRQARDIVDRRIRENLEARESFALESTFSGKSRARLLVRAKKLGYETVGVLVGTDDPRKNIARVANRVSEGGHGIEASEIIRRWHASQDNVVRYWRFFDRLQIWDTSEGSPMLVAEKRDTRILLHDASVEWAHTLVEKARNRTAGSPEEENER